MATFLLELVSPEKLLLSRQVEMATIPAAEGEMGVLPGHSPMIVTLRGGVIRVRRGAGGSAGGGGSPGARRPGVARGGASAAGATAGAKEKLLTAGRTSSSGSRTTLGCENSMGSRRADGPAIRGSTAGSTRTPGNARSATRKERTAAAAAVGPVMAWPRRLVPLRLLDGGADAIERFVEIDDGGQRLEPFAEHGLRGGVCARGGHLRGAEFEAGYSVGPGDERDRQIRVRPHREHRIEVGEHAERLDRGLGEQRRPDLLPVKVPLERRSIQNLLGARDFDGRGAMELERPPGRIDEQVTPKEPVRWRINDGEEAVGRGRRWLLHGRRLQVA